jgi:competence protein ComEA
VDPNATPWRVLEDPVEAPPGGVPPGDPAAPRWAVGRSTLVVGVAAIVLAIGAFVLAAGTSSGGSFVVDGGSALPGQSSGSSGRPDGSAPRGADTATPLVVEIVGAVDRPGVYRLANDARVGDLVAAAGGYGPRVDTDRAARELNLAALLHDGDQVRVPARGDAVATAPATTRGGAGPTKPGAGPAALIDLNRATAEELDTLPGIGPATAGKILASRDEQPFTSVDDLRSRKLVGEKTFAGLKDLVAVR